MRIVVLILICVITESLYGQRIGVFINQDYAFRSAMQDVRGSGLYLHFDDLSHKVELLIEAGINKRSRLYENDNRYSLSAGYISYHKDSYFSIKSLTQILKHQKSAYKFGVSFNYILVDAYHTGDAANWTSDRHLSSHTSIGLLLNYQYQNFLITNLNLDFFITPSYWILLKDSDPFFEEYSNHFIISLKFGLSYKLFSSKQRN